MLQVCLGTENAVIAGLLLGEDVLGQTLDILMCHILTDQVVILLEAMIHSLALDPEIVVIILLIPSVPVGIIIQATGERSPHPRLLPTEAVFLQIDDLETGVS